MCVVIDEKKVLEMDETIVRLRKGLAQAALELGEAVNLLRPTFPGVASIYETAAKKAASEALS